MHHGLLDVLGIQLLVVLAVGAVEAIEVGSVVVVDSIGVGLGEQLAEAIEVVEVVEVAEATGVAEVVEATGVAEVVEVATEVDLAVDSIVVEMVERLAEAIGVSNISKFKKIIKNLQMKSFFLHH